MKISISKLALAIVAALLVSGCFLLDGYFTAALACDYFASPNGTGNGLSAGSPFKISNFWSVNPQGKTLCLLDGTYTGAAGMIQPPQNLNGTGLQKITIKAVNDGAVLINAQNTSQLVPIRLQNNDHFIIEGVNACCSVGDVVALAAGADNNIIRRVVAWDANDLTNNMVFNIWNNTGNLLEDVAGFGKGRKTFQWSYGSWSATVIIRRAWGRWERHILRDDRGKIIGFGGPKMVFSAVYNSHGAIVENSIATWDASAMPAGYPVDQPYGLFTTDRLDGPNFNGNAKFLGNIGYVPNGAVLSGWVGGMFSASSVDGMEFRNNVIFLGSDHAGKRPTNVQGLNAGITGYSPANNHIYANNTEIGGSNAVVGMTETNRCTASTVAGCPNIWNGSGSNGARVCKRYENGNLTATPLWPWPMNQRIIDAMGTAGKTPVDVTRTMEQIFGTIPGECHSDGVPPRPTNLAVSQTTP